MPMPNPHVKVCCIASIDEAQMAISLGVSALGLVSAMPSGPGVIDEATIRAIAGSVPMPTRTFLLTSKQDATSIVAQYERCQTTTIQLVDALDPAEMRAVRRALRSVELVQVIHVVNEQSIDEAVAVASTVDAILLDSGNPSLAVKELGGTGRVHDWALSRRIRDAVHVPVYLAGGLAPDNVHDAIATVDPYGLDICTGVRTNGRLDGEKLRAFMAAART
jgi:phosphoribosylanthranilate isomerase